MKMDLALNNLQRMICHEIKPTNQLIISSLEPLRLQSSKYTFSTHVLGPKVCSSLAINSHETDNIIKQKL